MDYPIVLLEDVPMLKSLSDATLDVLGSRIAQFDCESHFHGGVYCRTCGLSCPKTTWH